MTSPYNPTTYDENFFLSNNQQTSNHSNYKTRAWQFTDYEDKPIAYLYAANNQQRNGANTMSSNYNNSLGSNKRNGDNKNDEFLHEILRNTAVPYNNHTSKIKNRGKKGNIYPWETNATNSKLLGELGRRVGDVAVPNGREGSWHKHSTTHSSKTKPKENGEEVIVDGAFLFAQKMGFKYARSFEDWKMLKDKEEMVSKQESKSERQKKIEEKLDREREGERKFNEWLDVRGRRIIDLEKFGWGKDEVQGVSTSINESENCENRCYIKRDAPRPWTKYMKTSEQIEKEEEVKLQLELLKAEEKEAREAKAHGLFLEWLSQKKLQTREARKAKAEKSKLEDEERETVRRNKWRKKIVVNCYSGEGADLIRKLGENLVIEEVDDLV